MTAIFKFQQHRLTTYTGLRADFRRAGSLLSVQIGLDRVVQEEGVLIEVVLRLLFSHTDGLRESLSRGL